MDDFLYGAVAFGFGVYLIIRRKQFAARTVRSQNWVGRKKYGPREEKASERAAILIGLFALVFAVMFWFG